MCFDEGIKNHPRYLEMDAFSQILFEIFHYSILPTLYVTMINIRWPVGLR